MQPRRAVQPAEKESFWRDVKHHLSDVLMTGVFALVGLSIDRPFSVPNTNFSMGALTMSWAAVFAIMYVVSTLRALNNVVDPKARHQLKASALGWVSVHLSALVMARTTTSFMLPETQGYVLVTFLFAILVSRGQGSLIDRARNQVGVALQSLFSWFEDGQDHPHAG